MNKFKYVRTLSKVQLISILENNKKTDLISDEEFGEVL
jgi:hypothetical protein